MTFVFKHPNYYKNLATNCRRDNKPQKEGEDEKATSDKQQAIDETVPHCDIEEATSNKRFETQQEGHEDS